MGEVIGWVATILLVLRTFPQVHKCYINGNANGLSKAFLWLWFAGQVLMIVYLLLEMLSIPLITYSFINVFSLLLIMRYKFFPRKKPIDTVEKL